MNIRKTALELLNKYELSEQYINLSLYSHSLDALTIEERRILTSLLYTTVEHRLTYDYYISAISKREIAKIDLYTKNILRLGICQILDISSVPDFAAVNESVKLARNVGERSFVNGVLRRIAANKDALPMPDKNKNYKRYLSVKYSFPLPTVKLFSTLFGEEETERLLEYFNTVKYTDIFVNTEKTTREALIESLSHEGITAKRSALSEYSLRIEEPFYVERLSSFKNGEFFVQDLASSLAVTALSPKPFDRVIDVCSCPGGKSFSSAVMMKNSGEIFSFDLHESKLSLIDNGASRLGLSVIRSGERDGEIPDESLFGTADKVICDVPCSGLGVLSKKPDLRYKDIENTSELTSLQYSILSSSVAYLKASGELLYSTCTLNPEENERVVERFLSEHTDFQAVDFTVGGHSSTRGMLTLVPHKSLTDGFFMAKIKRKI